VVSSFEFTQQNNVNGSYTEQNTIEFTGLAGTSFSFKIKLMTYFGWFKDYVFTAKIIGTDNIDHLFLRN